MKRWHGVLTGVAAVLMITATMQTALAQRGRRPSGGGPGGMMMGGFGGGASELGLLRRSDVQKELDLIPDQVKDLEKLSEDQRNSMRDLFSQLRNLSREQRTAKIRGVMEGIQKKVDDILLPNQVKRLKQLALQQRLRGGVSALLRDEKLTGELGISESEKQKIEAKAKEIEDQLRKKMAALRKQAQDQLIKSLTPQQQAKLKDMVGAPFEFQQQPRPQFGAGGAGGRAAFGGRRGGRPGRGG